MEHAKAVAERLSLMQKLMFLMLVVIGKVQVNDGTTPYLTSMLVFHRILEKKHYHGLPVYHRHKKYQLLVNAELKAYNNTINTLF